jgi:TonB family protein
MAATSGEPQIRESGDPARSGASSDDFELLLLSESSQPVSASRFITAGVGSILFHIVVLGIFQSIPETPPIYESTVATRIRQVTPLYIPKELTQRDPNEGRITKTLDARANAPSAAVPRAPMFRQPEPSPAPVPALPAPVVEPPKIEAANIPPPPPQASAGNLQQAPPPQVEKPKLAFENVGAQGSGSRPNSTPNLNLPRTSMILDDNLRAAMPVPATGRGNGDVEEIISSGSPGQGAASGPLATNLQLMSDPKGVDFKPYLVQLAAQVKTNWFAVIPESARIGGQRGRVLIQFIVSKNGAVPKLVIAEPSGAVSLDRAAVAAFSASHFPPLPAGFTGQEIRLQMMFTYNLDQR